jgi:hypothetical protein
LMMLKWVKGRLPPQWDCRRFGATKVAPFSGG